MTLDEIQALINLYLPSQSNILAVEHKAIETEVINYLRTLETKTNQIRSDLNKILPKNIGYFSGWDINGGNIGQSYPVSGDITSVILDGADNGNGRVRVTMQNPMSSLNYKVEHSIQSLGQIGFDDDIGSGVFKIISQNQFFFQISEFVSSVQNLRIHFKITSLE